MSLTAYGQNEAGGGVETALAATTALIITNRKICTDREPRRLVCSVASDVVIRLNYLISPDNGTNWVIGKQVASSVVTVDGATAGYVNSATLDVPIGFIYKVEVYNTTGGAGKIVYEYREYTAA